MVDTNLSLLLSRPTHGGRWTTDLLPRPEPCCPRRPRGRAWRSGGHPPGQTPSC